MSHYFETPGAERGRRTVSATIFGTDYEFTTAGGVFSADGLDSGTAVLVREAQPPQTARRLLDLGCGWGPIAVALADHCPEAIVDAIDTNELALALTRENASRAGVADRVRTLLPEQADPSVRYDEIWSNPPIRIGKAALQEMLLHWLARLAPHGVARLVVSRNLGADSLQRWLTEQGYDCRRVASAKGFRVFQIIH